ncbi:MAG: sensor histidine kinase [Planctomycetota bacterium]
MIRIWAVCGILGVANAATATEPVRIADVQALPRADLAGKPVVIRGGVVTWIKMPDRSRLTIQDGDRGMWITTTKPWPKSPDVWRGSADTLAKLAVGDEVEIEGILDPGGFAPKLLAHDLRIVGKGAVPAAIAVDNERFFNGVDECCRVDVTGVVQGFRLEEDDWVLVLERGTRRFEARIPRAGYSDPATTLVDAEVRLVGSAIAAFNARGELLYPRVVVMDAADVQVVEPPPCPPFEARLVPLADIATFSPEPVGPHRLRTCGTVNYVFHGGFYLQEGPTGIRVETADATPVAVDDGVEVTGFLDRHGHAAGLHDALVRVVGRGTPKEPIAIKPADVARLFNDARQGGTAATPGDYDGCLVTFAARLTDVERTPSGGRFLLAADDVDAGVVARMDRNTFARLEAIHPGSSIQVTGLLQIEAETPIAVWSELAINHFTVGLRSAADVRVLRAPPWWTPQRLKLLAAGLATVFAGALAWMALLRRQVKAQAERILHEMQSRRDAAVEFQATLRERSRLAANLHDTVLQTLAGVLLQLDLCRRSVSAPASDDAGDQLDVAKRMLRHAAVDLRGSVWALRTQPLAGRSFSESLAAVIQHFATPAGPPGADGVHLWIEGEPFELPKFVAGNLLLVVQEAIRNARHHAEASRVDVAVRFDPADKSVTVTVHDDGPGFDVATAAGPEQGHFGLQGMRERITNLGGRFKLVSRPGAGTTVTVRVTVGSHDSELDADAHALRPTGVAGAL